MFLDDELYKMCKNRDIKKSWDIESLYIELICECEGYIREKVKKCQSSKEIKAVIDRSFNLWESFVTKLKNDPDSFYVELGESFDEYSLKKMYLDNEITKKIYESL